LVKVNKNRVIGKVINLQHMGKFCSNL